MGERGWCADGKYKLATEEAAKAAAVGMTEKTGGNFRVYECPCGSWHVYDRDKKRQKDEARESRNARRRRRRRELRGNDREA